MKHFSSLSPRHLKVRPLAFLLAAALLPQAQGQTLPGGLNVAAGQATVQVNGGQMTVTNSANAILNWQSFSIGAGNGVHFVQPSAASQVLNRVTGNDPSAILGSLSSNGRVWLLNPNGVLFGQGARVDVAGLVVSTLNLSNQDWLAGRYAFGSSGPAAGVVNEGQLRTSLGGRVALLGGTVENRGLIETPGGQVVLAAGQSVELLDTGAPHLSVKVTAPQGEALNLGTLAAAGGRIDIHAAAVNQQGIVRADSLERGPAGEIVLKASERLSLLAGSVTAADGETGGRVTLLGREVGLFDDASVSASGRLGGGEVFVGGGQQGRDTSLPNAQAVFFGPDASISADATERGDGGRIILWSDVATRAFGSLSARGGSLGGNGGFIETSGRWLDARPRRLDVTAPHGQAGNWLLDPYDITISDEVSDAGFNASFTATGNDATISTSTLNAALATGAQVTVSTSGGGSQSGSIYLDGANIGGSSCLTNQCRLTLLADQDIRATSYSSINGNFSEVFLRAGDSGSITLENASIDVTGRVRLQASSVTLESDAWVRSSASGDAIVISNGSRPVSSFYAFVTEGLPLLVNGGGRWIIWASGINSEGFYAGDLARDFTRYGATSASAWAGDVGNGLVTDDTLTANVSGSAATRAYDGTRNATVRGLTYSLDEGFNASLNSTAYALFDSKNVVRGSGGAPAAQSVSYYDDSHASPFQFTDSDNKPVYGLTVNTSISGVIQPKQVTASMAGVSKVYDGNTAASITVGSVSGLVGNETLNIAAQGQFSDKNVGTNKAVTLNDYQVGDGGNGGLAQNYNVVVPLSLVGDITPLLLSVSGLVADNKVYDATTLATLSGSASVAGLAGDSVSLNQGQARFSDKNVGQGKTVTLSGFSLTGADAGNYSLQLPASVTADITPLAVTLNGVVANNKVYDATTVATLGGSASVAGLAGDSLGLNQGQARFSDKNVGQGKTVTLSGFSLTGADAGNYSLQLPASVTADITPLAVTLNGVVVNNKVYDATTLATLGGSASVAGLAGDSLGLNQGQARFSDKNVGQGKTVTLSGFSLTGADAGNYSLQLPAHLTADITAAMLTISGLTANNKVYDGTRQAGLSGTAAIAPLGTDQVSLGGTMQALFNDGNVGTAKPVTVSGFTISGADAGNYALQQPIGLAASITPATLSYVAQPLFVFTGDPLPTPTGQVEGFVPGDTQASATTGILSFSLSLTSSLAPTGGYGITGSGLQAANYVLVQAPGNSQALVVAGPNPAAAQGQSGNATLVQALQTVLPPPPVPNRQSAGLLDLTRPIPPAGAGQATGPAGDLFGGIDVGGSSSAQLRGILAARDSYKRALFAESLERLAQNPGLADLPPCANREELEAGNCLITAELKRDEQARLLRQAATVAAAPSVSAPTPTPAPVPSATPATPALAAPAVAAPPPMASLFSKRRVKTAALPQIERKLALLIGVDRYADAEIPQLGNAVGDARAVAGLFESRLGYETVVLPNASKQAVVSALNRLALELGPKDSVTIYYAGHGAVVDATGLGYWQLADSSAKRPESWLSNADIGRLMSQLGASQVALISDSCYSGTLVSGERIRVTPGTVDPGQVLSHRSMVVMSSGGNEPVFDDGKDGHSPFAWSLMKQLGGVGNWQMGGNVFERVRFAVARELPQRPQYGAVVGHQSGGDYLFEQRQLDVRQ
jgi:filamentous hemagglutinin family protein